MASNLKDDPYYVTRDASGAGSENDNRNFDYDQFTSDMQQQVQEKPVSSVAIAVGVGIGAGLLLSTLLSSERSQKQRFARRVGSFLSGSGQLRSSVENFLPDSITDRYFN